MDSLIPADRFIPNCPLQPLTTLHPLLAFFKYEPLSAETILSQVQEYLIGDTSQREWLLAIPPHIIHRIDIAQSTLQMH